MGGDEGGVEVGGLRNEVRARIKRRHIALLRCWGWLVVSPGRRGMVSWLLEEEGNRRKTCSHLKTSRVRRE
jgi:hypothetical protein